MQVSRQPRDFHGTADPGPADDPAERERGRRAVMNACLDGVSYDHPSIDPHPPEAGTRLGDPHAIHF